MTDRHTPGPWKVTGIGNEAYPWGYVEVAPCRRITIEGRSYDEAKANAFLVAAAPELLDALTDMIAGWRYIREQHGDLPGVGWDRAQQKAETALAKVRGLDHD